MTARELSRKLADAEPDAEVFLVLEQRHPMLYRVGEVQHVDREDKADETDRDGAKDGSVYLTTGYQVGYRPIDEDELCDL